jgi:hypothetical protein
VGLRRRHGVVPGAKMRRNEDVMNCQNVFRLYQVLVKQKCIIFTPSHKFIDIYFQEERINFSYKFQCTRILKYDSHRCAASSNRPAVIAAIAKQFNSTNAGSLEGSLAMITRGNYVDCVEGLKRQ